MVGIGGYGIWNLEWWNEGLVALGKASLRARKGGIVSLPGF